MKKFLLMLACFAGAYSGRAQVFTVPYDTVKATYSGTGIMTLHDNITNTTANNITVEWKVTACTFPNPAWITDTAFAICDVESCYGNIGGALTNGNLHTPVYGANATHDSVGDFHLQLDLGWPSAANYNGVYYTVVNLKSGSYSKNIVFQIGKYAQSVGTTGKKDDDVVLYPNPAKNNLYLAYTGNAVIKTITIHNLIGKLVCSFNTTGNNVQLDIADMPAGVYYLRLNNAEGQLVATRRFTHQ